MKDFIILTIYSEDKKTDSFVNVYLRWDSVPFANRSVKPRTGRNTGPRCRRISGGDSKFIVKPPSGFPVIKQKVQKYGQRQRVQNGSVTPINLLFP